MRIKTAITILTLLILVAFSGAARSQEVEIKDIETFLDISTQVRIADVTQAHLNAMEEDATAFFKTQLLPSASSESIATQYGLNWQVNGRETIRNESSTQATWVEVSLANNGSTVSNILIEAERFSGVGWLYLDGSGSLVRQTPAFDAYLGGRVVFDSEFVIPIQLLPNEEKIIFIAVYSLAGAGAGDMVLWEPEAFRADRSRNQFIDALYFGFLIAFVLYHLFWAVVMRRLTFLYAAGFQFCVVTFIFVSTGYGALFLFANNIGLILPVYGILLYAAAAFSSLVSINLLDINHSNPWLHKLWLINLAFAVVPIPVIYVVGQPQFLNPIVVSFIVIYSMMSFSYSQLLHLYTLMRFWSFSLVTRLWFIIVISQIFLLAVWQILIAIGLGFIEGIRPVVQVLTLLEASLLSVVIGMLVRDEQRARMEAQQESLDNLKMANDIQQSKSEFIATAGHDLRQPLEAMRFHVSSLKQNATEKIAGPLQKIENNIMELSSLLGSLMNLSSGTVYVEKADYEVFSLNEVLQSVRSEFEPFALQKQLALKISETDIILCSNKVGLVQILRNVVGNSLKFTRSGYIELLIKREGGRLLLVVKDTGCGIAANELENIFNEFYQVEGAEKQGQAGLGLGLSIVRRLTETLEIPVKVDSTLDIGTCFEFDLTALEHSAVQSPEAAKLSRTLSGCEVVFLGAASDSSVTIRSLVETWGASIQVVSTLEKFKEEYSATKLPDLLVIAEALYEPLTQNQLLEDFSAVPVIVLSSLPMEAQSRNSSEENNALHHWFSAPINPGILRSFIQRIVLNASG